MNKTWQDKLEKCVLFDEGQEDKDLMFSRLLKGLPKLMDDYASAVLNDKKLQESLLV